MNNEEYSDLTLNEYTENILDETCFSAPADSDDPKDIIKAIKLGTELDERPVFLEGLSERLTALGTKCTSTDTDIMLSEIKGRYTNELGKSCPRTVIEWIRGTTPGTTNRQNNYDLCYALKMDLKETASFFQKHFLTIPFILKSTIDSIFYYCLLNKKPYAVVRKMLDDSKNFTPKDRSETSTANIRTAIRDIKNDDEFLSYLSDHCYTQKQQFRLAKSLISDELALIKEMLIEDNRVSRNLLEDAAEPELSPDRLTRLTIFSLLGYKYRGRETSIKNLPKRFTESLPNDVTLGKIINDEEVSYELLRKTLMLLKFHNFYYEAENSTDEETLGNLLDFKEELNSALDSCGFSLVYMCHPFDCMLMYCANSYEPLGTLHSIIEYGRNHT